MKHSKRILQLLSCMLVIFIMFGCKGTDERKAKLEKGIGLIRSFTNPNPVDKAAMVNYNADSNPSGMVMLYHASADPNIHPNVYADRQSLEPWSLLILPGTKDHSLIVEGYGDDLKKPVIVEEIVFNK